MTYAPRSRPVSSPVDRSLTVACRSGLANRLRVLLSGLAVAEVTGRAFAMDWPRTAACGATFDELFANRWPVQPSTPEACGRYPLAGQVARRAGPGWLAGAERHLAVQEVGWLYATDPSLDRQAMAARAACYLAELDLLPALRQRIDAFAAAHFRPTMIGVHLRRGDFLHRRPDVVANTALALAAVDRFLAGAPEAGILLCTDDGAVDPLKGAVPCEGIREIFFARYGSRVIHTTPRSLDRHTTAAIQDALIELWLLRRTDCLVGSGGSSFSELAAFGRVVPAVQVSAESAAFRRLAAFCRRSGVEALLRRAPLSDRFAPETPFQFVWEFYASLPGRAVRRLRRRW